MLLQTFLKYYHGHTEVHKYIHIHTYALHKFVQEHAYNPHILDRNISGDHVTGLRTNSIVPHCHDLGSFLDDMNFAKALLDDRHTPVIL